MESMKRRMPVVEPVKADGVRYQITRAPRLHGFEQNSGVISAIDEATGAELWQLAVYPIAYDEAEEADVQDVFITRLSLAPGGKTLKVLNERGERFEVNLADRSVKKVK